jgi:hypothetical protein
LCVPLPPPAPPHAAIKATTQARIAPNAGPRRSLFFDSLAMNAAVRISKSMQSDTGRNHTGARGGDVRKTTDGAVVVIVALKP